MLVITIVTTVEFVKLLILLSPVILEKYFFFGQGMGMADELVTTKSGEQIKAFLAVEN